MKQRQTIRKVGRSSCFVIMLALSRRRSARFECRFPDGASFRGAIPRFFVRVALLGWLTVCCAPSQTAAPAGEETPRIFGILPTFGVSNSTDVKPLTWQQKFNLFARETYDPGTIAAAAAGAAMSQAQRGDPDYGQGGAAYAKRFGAAMADITTQSFFQGVLLAGLLHEDPRYFRRGSRYGLWNRVGYAMSRVVITRTDAGRQRFNYSGIIGMGMGIGLSNAYYPASSVNGTEIASRFATSLASSAFNNLLPEFWPDIHRKLFHHRK
jgi:hypothetical protein